MSGKYEFKQLAHETSRGKSKVAVAAESLDAKDKTESSTGNVVGHRF